MLEALAVLAYSSQWKKSQTNTAKINVSVTLLTPNFVGKT